MYTIRKGKHHINFINSRALPEPYWAFVKEDRELAEIELGPGIFGIDHCTPYPDFIIACGLVTSPFITSQAFTAMAARCS